MEADKDFVIKMNSFIKKFWELKPLVEKAVETSQPVKGKRKGYIVKDSKGTYKL